MMLIVVLRSRNRCGRGCQAALGSRDGVLAGPSSRALAGDHHSREEQLTAPDTPRLAPLAGARQALGPDRTVLAQRLRELHVAGRLGEVQLRVLPAARQLRLVDR